jgi:hypothetical protein
VPVVRRAAPSGRRRASRCSLLAGAFVPAMANPSSSEVRSDLRAAQERYEEIDRERGMAQNEYNDALGELEFAEASLAALRGRPRAADRAGRRAAGDVADHVRLLHRMGPSLELSMLAASQPAEIGLRSTTLRQVLDRQRVDLEALTAPTSPSRQPRSARRSSSSVAAWTETLEERNAELQELVQATAGEVAELEDRLQLAVQREEAEAARQRELERQRELVQRAHLDLDRDDGAAPATRSSVGGAVGSRWASSASPTPGAPPARTPSTARGW